MGILFESLDFLYVPAPDIDAAIGYYTGVLGSKLLWKIHAFGERHAYKFQVQGHCCFLQTTLKRMI
jgi:catechol 2,3-dioxygenase-like lactoylglutathione lyase family enzyme